MADSIIKLRGLMVKALDCRAKGPWFKSHQGHLRSLLLQKLYLFSTFFKNLTFNIKNYCLSNQFWVRNASFQRKRHLKYQILIWVTLKFINTSGEIVHPSGLRPLGFAISMHPSQANVRSILYFL